MRHPAISSASLLLMLFAAVDLHAQSYTIQGKTYRPTGPIESLSASFMAADGGTSIGTYSGFVRVVVAGSGVSCTPAANDAFYIYEWQPGCTSSNAVPAHDPWYYQMTFDTQPLMPLQQARDVKNFIYYDIIAGVEVLSRPYVPPYHNDHTYIFIINTGLTSPARLHFGVSDGAFGDNSGAYDLLLTQLTEGPAPIQVTSFGPNGPPPFTPGATVTFSATATGGQPPLEYKFWLYREGVGWSVLQDYSPAPTVTWTATPAGTYTLQVWSRSAGSLAAYEAWRSYGPFDVRVTPLQVTSLAANVSLPAVAGTPITWTATTSGGTAPHSYQFHVFNGSTWSVGRDWSAAASWTWAPPLPGNYVIQVWVRDAGSLNAYDAWLGATAPVSAPAVLTVTAVTPSADSATAGAPVTWTAYAAGGVGPYTYRFFVFDGAQWTIGQEWSASNTWTWIPPSAGSFTFQVWVRGAGSGAAYDAWHVFGPYTATKPSALVVTTLSANPPGPVPAGTPVTWTAGAAGGSTPYTYKFYVYDGVSWTLARDWAASQQVTWVPPASGNYSVQVWARNAGSDAAYDAWKGGSIAVTAPSALTITGATTDPALPVPAGTPVTWTALARGGTGPYTYKFYVFDGVSWSVGQNWSAANTWTWVPPTAGNYWVQVWARNAGSMNDYDAWAPYGATVSGAAPLAAPTVTLAPMAPLMVGGPAVITAKTRGGTGPYTYQFYLFDGSTWSVGQAWSPANTFVWTPSASGTYYLQVWVRNAGSVATYDQWAPLGPLTVLP